VSDVVGAVLGLLHRFQRDGLDEVLFGLAMHFGQQLVDALAHFPLGATCTQLITEAGYELLQVIQFLGVRQVVYAIDECLGFLVLGYFANAFGHSAVGQQHELLNKFVGLFRLLEIDTEWLAVFIDVEAHLHTVEVDGSGSKTFLRQALCQAIEGKDFILERRPLPLPLHKGGA